MADRPNRVGHQLGNYRLISVLGEGGFAEVYLGEHIHLGTKAAVKVLHTQLTNENVDAFRTEARTIAHLVHPHIVRVFDFGVEGTTPFLVMDYAPNGTLRQIHPKGSSLALATIIAYVKQVTDALQYAHDEKLIHRDIKPENMLVGRRNEVLLSDFGIALVAQSSRYQSIQDVIGTIVYMSPEQIQGKPRPASDQYSLGIVVYEWLCGNRPFHGTFTELCAQHMFAPPPSLREKVPSISSDVEQVVMTALAKDPKLRFVSVQAFATALEQASLSGQSQPSVSPRGNILPIQPLSPAVPVTPPNQSPQPTSDVLPVNRPSTLGQTSLSEQMQPSVPHAEVTPSNQPLPPTILAIPPNLPNPSSEPTTDVPPRSHAPHAPEVSGTQLPLPQPMNHLSRRAVIAGLVGPGLAVIGGGSIIWFVMSQKSTSNLPPPITPTPTSLSIGPLRYMYKGHSGWVNGVAWSPEGKRIASGSDDKTVQVWDATNGGNVFTYRGHSDGVLAVAWSPDGNHIASGSIDHTVQVWNATNGGNTFTYKGHSGWVDAVAWSPDGSRIASGSTDTTVQVWDATNGGNAFTYKGHSGWVNTVAWSPDGKRIASADNTVQVWDATNGGNTFTYKGHSGWVSAVVWSPDGKRIASGSIDDNTVQVWDATNGGNAFTYKGHSGIVSAVAWSPDGKRIASGSFDDTVQVWDAVDGENAFTYRGHSNAVDDIAWSPDGKRIASGSRDNTVQVWVAS
jgi:WD40 repeat protein